VHHNRQITVKNSLWWKPLCYTITSLKCRVSLSVPRSQSLSTPYSSLPYPHLSLELYQIRSCSKFCRPTSVYCYQKTRAISSVSEPVWVKILALMTAKRFHSGNIQAQKTVTTLAIWSKWSVWVNWTHLSSRNRPCLLLLRIFRHKFQRPESKRVSYNLITRKRKIIVHWICNLSSRQLNL